MAEGLECSGSIVFVQGTRVAPGSQDMFNGVANQPHEMALCLRTMADLQYPNF
jgi:hypothetical protein